MSTKYVPTAFSGDVTPTQLNAEFARISVGLRNTIARNTATGATIDSGNQMEGDLSLNSHKITNVADGVAPQDVVTKKQLDAVTIAAGGSPVTAADLAAVDAKIAPAAIQAANAAIVNSQQAGQITQLTADLNATDQKANAAQAAVVAADAKATAAATQASNAAAVNAQQANAISAVQASVAAINTVTVVTSPPLPTNDPGIAKYPVSTRAQLQQAFVSFANGNQTFVDSTYGGPVAHIQLTADINMDGATGFSVGNQPQRVYVHGGGHKLFRTANQEQVPLLDLNGLNHGITFEWTTFDDGLFTGTPQNGGLRMIWVRNCNNVRFDRCKIANSRGYLLYVQQTNGFMLRNSEIYGAGTLGVYVGHDFAIPSQNVQILNNHFHDNATNALALQGVNGATQNKVLGNRFERNHIYGRFASGNSFTGGGQMYLARVLNCLVQDNVITNGYGVNTIKRDRPVDWRDVTGIEIGKPGDNLRVAEVTIANNEVSGNTGWAIRKNSSVTLAANVLLFENRIFGNGVDTIDVAGATVHNRSTTP